MQQYETMLRLAVITDYLEKRTALGIARAAR
jgi:hypothetical protein